MTDEHAAFIALLTVPVHFSAKYMYICLSCFVEAKTLDKFAVNGKFI